jgi:hypothetical protein
MTFCLYLIIAGLLAYGWLTPNPIFAKVGAIIYLLMSAFSLIGTYQASKQYRNGEWEPENKKQTMIQILSRVLELTILFVGLFAMMIGQQDDKRGLLVAGIIIWVGNILVWLISGFIAQSVAGIPLRMTYGGWKVYRPHRRRRKR